MPERLRDDVRQYLVAGVDGQWPFWPIAAFRPLNVQGPERSRAGPVRLTGVGTFAFAQARSSRCAAFATAGAGRVALEARLPLRPLRARPARRSIASTSHPRARTHGNQVCSRNVLHPQR
jgi:hypothetical protein